MVDTDWFADSVEHHRKTILPYWALALLILCVGLLFGCAPQTKAEPQHPLMVCYMKLIGQTDEGYSVVAQQCETAEEFRASQN